MDPKDVSLEVSVETIAVLSDVDSETQRPDDANDRQRGTEWSPPRCCP